jgi:hypothetical protein
MVFRSTVGPKLSVTVETKCVYGRQSKQHKQYKPGEQQSRQVFSMVYGCRPVCKLGLNSDSDLKSIRAGGFCFPHILSAFSSLHQPPQPTTPTNHPATSAKPNPAFMHHAHHAHTPSIAIRQSMVAVAICAPSAAAMQRQTQPPHTPPLFMGQAAFAGPTRGTWSVHTSERQRVVSARVIILKRSVFLKKISFSKTSRPKMISKNKRIRFFGTVESLCLDGCPQTFCIYSPLPFFFFFSRRLGQDFV